MRGRVATLFIPQDPQLNLFSVFGLAGIRYIIVLVSVSYIAVAPIAAGGLGVDASKYFQPTPQKNPTSK